MKFKVHAPVALAAALRAEPERPWTLDVTLYGVAAGMSGDVTVMHDDAGSSLRTFKYDVLTQGPPLGFTCRF
jgi:hypothetical protein